MSALPELVCVPHRVVGCLQCKNARPIPTVDARVEISLRIGQPVRHHDHAGKRVTGKVRGLSIDSDRVLMADIVLDAPIVIPAISADDREIKLWHQHVPAHELTPFDERDEVIAELLDALERARSGLAWYQDRNPGQADGSDDEAMAQIDAAIAKARRAA